MDRLSHHNGQIRHAESDQIALFQLGIGDGCAQRVDVLLENDVYVYLGQWANDKDGRVIFFKKFYTDTKSDCFLEPIWLTKNSSTDVQIYLNPGLIDLIKTSFFNSPMAFGYKYKDY